MASASRVSGARPSRSIGGSPRGRSARAQVERHLSPGGVGAKSCTTPPGAARWSAPAMACGSEVHTKTWSASSPPSASRTAAGSRPAVAAAPARGRGPGGPPEARRPPRPRRRARRRPPPRGGPWRPRPRPPPVTRARSPLSGGLGPRTPAARRAWPPRAGGRRAAAGRRRARSARGPGCSSARPPGSMRVRRKVAQSVWRPARQRAAVAAGHVVVDEDAVAAGEGRAGPTACTTSPAGSCPARAAPGGPGTRS